MVDGLDALASSEVVAIDWISVIDFCGTPASALFVMLSSGAVAKRMPMVPYWSVLCPDGHK